MPLEEAKKFPFDQLDGHRIPLTPELRRAALRAEMAELEAAQPDAINHPPHYTSHPSGVECIDIVEPMPFNVGNAIKYLWRAGLKDPANPITDLKKAVWYVQREIKRLSKGR